MATPPRETLDRTNRRSLDRVTRRVLGQTTRENLDPNPHEVVQQLQDELDLVTVEWNQEYKDLQDKLKLSEEDNKVLNEALSREIHFAVTTIITEMIRTIVREENRKKEA